VAIHLLFAKNFLVKFVLLSLKYIDQTSFTSWYD